MPNFFDGYLALGSGSSQDFNEFLGSGYDRKSITFASVTVPGNFTNTTGATFSATGTWPPVTQAALIDASGHVLLFWQRRDARPLSSGATLLLAAGEISITVPDTTERQGEAGAFTYARGSVVGFEGDANPVYAGTNCKIVAGVISAAVADADTLDDIATILVSDGTTKVDIGVALSVLASSGTEVAKPTANLLGPTNLVENRSGTISPLEMPATISAATGDGYKLTGQSALRIDAKGNLCVGLGAGSNNSGALNTFVGQNAGQYNTYGGENTFVGEVAGQFITTGRFNTAIGEHALGYATTSSGDTALGNDAMRNYCAGSGNTMSVAIGKNAMYAGGSRQSVAVGASALVGSGTTVMLDGTVTGTDTIRLTFTGGFAGSPRVVTTKMTGLNTLAQAAQAILNAVHADAILGTPGGVVGGNIASHIIDGTNIHFTFQGADRSSGGGGTSATGLSIVITAEVIGAGTETVTILGGNTGGQNIAIGHQALVGYYLTTGANNVAMGTGTLYSLQSGSSNFAFGFNTLNSLRTGADNVGMGHQALTLATTAQQNIAIGTNAGGSLRNSGSNTFVGYRAGWKTATGASNVAIGSGAMTNATAGNANVVIGQNALNGAATGSSNTVVGNGAFENQASTAGGQVVIGQGAAARYTGGDSGSPNVIVGTQAGNGTSAAFTSTVLIGYRAGNVLASGGGATLLGFKTGSMLTSAGNNTIIGCAVASTTLTSGTGNILIGVDSNTDTAATGTCDTLQIRGRGTTVTPALQATDLNTANPKVAIAAGTGAGAPMAGTDIPDKTFMCWKNTSDGSVRLYYNDGGMLKSLAFT
ncbi:MAG: hypothetical protein JSS43_33175 [Proteobacteria bacterium]|nr:hypothetical protein [Pseudomonadota bacterium]